MVLAVAVAAVVTDAVGLPGRHPHRRRPVLLVLLVEVGVEGVGDDLRPGVLVTGMITGVTGVTVVTVVLGQVRLTLLSAAMGMRDMGLEVFPVLSVVVVRARVPSATCASFDAPHATRRPGAGVLLDGRLPPGHGGPAARRHPRHGATRWATA